MKSKQYVVLLENEDGCIQCIKVCENLDEAYGAAYLALADGIEDEDSFYYITTPERRNGGCGFFVELKKKENDKTMWFATVLFYEEDEKE